MASPTRAELAKLTLDRRVALWEPQIRAALARVAPLPSGVDVALVKAMIATESEGYPDAKKSEAHLESQSLGLMQIVPKLHYSGNPADLLDPQTNLNVGVALLVSLVRARGNVWGGVSSYNGGPGVPVKVATTFCLEWKPTAPKTGRVISRDCARPYTAQPGEYPNQPYVTRVRGYYSRFGGGGAVSGASAPGKPATAPITSGATPLVSVGGVSAGGLSQSPPAGGGKTPPKTGRTTTVVAGGLGLLGLFGLLLWLYVRGGAGR